MVRADHREASADSGSVCLAEIALCRSASLVLESLPGLLARRDDDRQLLLNSSVFARLTGQLVHQILLVCNIFRTLGVDVRNTGRSPGVQAWMPTC